MKIISRKEAQALKLERYFTGMPCKYGHISERRVRNSYCLACKRVDYLNFQKTEIAKERARLAWKSWEKRARAALRALKELGIEI